MSEDYASQWEYAARGLASLVDPCTCSVVRKHLESSRSPIQDIILVGEELELEKGAGLFCAWGDETAECLHWKQLQIAMLVEAGQLMGLTWPQVGEMVFRWQDIPDDWACRVIYLSPLYVVKLNSALGNN